MLELKFRVNNRHEKIYGYRISEIILEIPLDWYCAIAWFNNCICHFCFTAKCTTFKRCWTSCCKNVSENGSTKKIADKNDTVEFFFSFVREQSSRWEMLKLNFSYLLEKLQFQPIKFLQIFSTSNLFMLKLWSFLHFQLMLIIWQHKNLLFLGFFATASVN